MRGGAIAALAVAAAAVACVLVQPIDATWVLGDGYEGGYPPSALSIVEGEQPTYLDHPGMPLNQALAAAFTIGWLADGAPGSRHDRAQALAADLDTTRPYSRTLGSLAFVTSALLVFAVLRRFFTPAWAAVGALLFLGAPNIITFSLFIAPDPAQSALALAIVALLVGAVLRRDPSLYLLAAAVLGFAVTIKVHAIGLLVPFALALALAPPAGWMEALRRRASRLPLRVPALAAAAWIALGVAVTVLAGPDPDADDTLAVAIGLLTAAVVAAAGVAAFARTRFAEHARAAAVIVAALIVGAVVPNLLYAGVVPTMLREIAATLSGGRVNSTIELFSGAIVPPRPWWPILALAAVGLALALRRGERESLLWAAGAVAMGVLAAARYGVVHYWAPTVVLAIPLALRALARPGRPPHPLALALVALMLVAPVRASLREIDRNERLAERVEEAHTWVAARLAPREAALTMFNSDLWLQDVYERQPFDTGERLLPARPWGAAYARRHGFRIRYVVLAEGSADQLLRDLALPGRARRVPSRTDVFEVS